MHTVATVARPLCGWIAAAAAAPPLGLRTLITPTTHPALFATLAQVTAQHTTGAAPPQRALLAGRKGRPRPYHGRRTLAQVAGAGRNDYGSVGGVRGAHTARSAAGAAPP